MSGIVPKQNALKFKIAPHKQKSNVKMFLAGRYEAPLANEALCLSTPKHNGKSMVLKGNFCLGNYRLART
jgi:hypothetical protein